MADCHAAGCEGGCHAAASHVGQKCGERHRSGTGLLQYKAGLVVLLTGTGSRPSELGSAAHCYSQQVHFSDALEHLLWTAAELKHML